MALITCVECKNTVSDLAAFCPHCGYPINSQPITNKGLNKPNRARKYRRLPNGYGNIKKLTGKRRLPYAAYPPVIEYNDSGSAVKRKALGYFATYQEAMDCLVEYNKNPAESETKNITFEEVYKQYYADKFNDEKRTYSKSLKIITNAGFNNLKDIHKKPIASLRTMDMQRVIDNCTLKHASLEQMRLVLKGVCKFALQNDYIQKDYSQFVRIKIADDDEKGIPFTEEDIKKFWKHKDLYGVQIVLIMIYSGFRISELETVKIDLESNCFTGGLKTKAGKNRTVPIHKSILPFVGALSETPFNSAKFRNNIFYPMLNDIGVAAADSGVKHTPHDCRHTFSWLADKYKLDTLSKHMIMGHSLGNDIEATVYGHRTPQELAAEINKIKVPK